MEETQRSQQGAETQSESRSDEQYKYSLNNMKTFSTVKILYSSKGEILRSQHGAKTTNSIMV